MPRTSVVVPCHGSAEYLPELLRSLDAQTFGEPWELILVDNRSTDELASLVRAHAGRLNWRIVAAPDRANASYARNRGVAAAAADRILFVDADDEVGPGYVAAMTAALDAHELVTSRVDSTTLNPAWTCEAQGRWQDTGVEVALGFLPATGINIGLRRSLFERIGGFAEDMDGSEDIAFSWQSQLVAGAQIHFVLEAVYRYRHRHDLLATFEQSRLWGRSDVRLYRRFRERGMPGRSLRVGAREWASVVAGLPPQRKGQFGARIARLGYCVGRLQGSLRERICYL